MGTIYLLVWLDPSRAPTIKCGAVVRALQLLWQVSPMVILFSIVTGTIYLGVATPTEASAFGAFGAFCSPLARARSTRRRFTQTLLRAATAPA